MLLTLSTTHRPASDLGYLLHKHPDRFQSFPQSYGSAHVFYPEVGEERCSACLLLEVDPVVLSRGKGHANAPLAPYVNDRPYVASSLMSVAIADVFGSAMQGKCKDRPDLVSTAIPLGASLDVLPVRGGESLLRSMFEPLGYEVEARRLVLDERFADWGDSPYYSVTVRKTTTVAELLTHLYVLIPVFDNQKHYYVGEDEIAKLLARGEGWLAAHPMREEIARRYLRRQASLVREALARLVPEESATLEEERPPTPEQGLEATLSLNEQRLGAVLAAMRSSGARRVLDLGCGEGKLLRDLARDKQFEEIVGVDVAVRPLEIARERLDRMAHAQAQRVTLLHGSLVYRDKRLAGFDAAAVVEVVEHLDPPRLAAFERCLFEFARPGVVVLTTPNREYNVMWPTLPAGKFRHGDHRFEWTRAEFASWAEGVSRRFGYSVAFQPVGPVDEALGPPTQMGVFHRVDGGAA
jgi:3' terminal RNA ribose 2'-O-methyltransferase Hen1